MSKPIVIIERVVHADPHMNGKVLILRGRWDQVPEHEADQHPTTIKHTIQAAALVAGTRSLEVEKEHVRKTVEEYVANYLAIESAAKEL